MIKKIAFSVIVSFFVAALIALSINIYWPDKPDIYHNGSHNIALGPQSGWSYTTESYQFSFSDGKYDYRTTMTHKEWTAVYSVLQRALENPCQLPVIISGDTMENNPSFDQNKFCSCSGTIGPISLLNTGEWHCGICGKTVHEDLITIGVHALKNFK